MTVVLIVLFVIGLATLTRERRAARHLFDTSHRTTGRYTGRTDQ